MSFDFRSARHALPTPLALLITRLQSPDPVERLRETFTFVEGVARWFAWIAVADAAARNTSPKQLREWMRARGLGGLLHALHKAVEMRPPGAFAAPMFHALTPAVWTAFDAVRRLRNDDAHDRLPRDPRVAQGALDSLAPHLAVIADALAPLTRCAVGTLTHPTVTHDGRLEAHWIPARGLTLQNVPVPVTDAQGLPTHTLLLLDLDTGTALTLTPFVIANLDALYWLEIPASDDHGRRSVYRPIVAEGAPPPPTLPTLLADARGATGTGLELDAWLARAEQRPRHIPLRLDAPSRERILRATQPTMLGAVAPDLAYAPTLIAPNAAAFPATIETPSHPHPSVAPIAPSPTIPVSAPTMPMTAPDLSGQYAVQAPVAFVPGALPSYGTLQPSARSAPVTHATPAWQYAVALFAGVASMAVVVLAVSVLQRERREQHVEVPTPVRTTTAPEQRVIPDRPLTERPDLRQWLARWTASVTQQSLALDDGTHAIPRRLDTFYARNVSFHGARNVTIVAINARWVQRRQANRFDVTLADSSWLPSPPSRWSNGCKVSGGDDGEVVLLSVAADERGSQVVKPPQNQECPHVQGRYLLEVRRIGGDWRVCTESWRTEDLRRDCPALFR